MYKVLLNEYSVVHVSRLCWRFLRVKFGDQLYSSQAARTDRNSFICAYWLGDDEASISTAASCRPGCVQYYIKHNVSVECDNGQQLITMYLGYITWYKRHPEKAYFPSPVTLWDLDNVPLSVASFMPISRIICRCMQGKLNMSFPDRPYNNGKVVVINPISNIIINL